MSVGVNVVLAFGVSSGHAEVMALGTAQKAIGGWDLGGAGLPEHELVVNWRPCAQCYGATMWSGVGTLVVAGSGAAFDADRLERQIALLGEAAEVLASEGVRAGGRASTRSR